MFARNGSVRIGVLAGLAMFGLAAAAGVFWAWQRVEPQRPPLAQEAGPAPTPPAHTVADEPEPPAPVPAPVTVTAPAPAPVPARAEVEGLNKGQVLPTRPFRVWAIVVGVDAYQGAIPACSGAVADARTIAGWFRQTARWELDHVLVLDDKGGPIPGDPSKLVSRPIKATREALEWAVRDWLGARLKGGVGAPPDEGQDVVVFYFAGQAATVPSTDPDDPRLRTLLLPADAALGDPAQPDSLRNGFDLAAALDEIPPSRRDAVVCWLDTSPVGRGKRVGSWTLPGAPADRRAAKGWLESLLRWQGVSAWLASADGPSEEAKPGAGQPAPGPFVLALAQGLGNDRVPRSLEECLSALGGTLGPKGFVQAGGFPRDLFLWPWQKVQGQRVPEPVLQRGHLAAVTAFGLTPQNELITGGGSQDSVLKVWSPKSLRVVQEYGGHLAGVQAVGVLRGGRPGTPAGLLSGDNWGQLSLRPLDPDAVGRIDRLPYRGGRPRQIVVSPGGGTALVRDERGDVWTVRRGPDGPGDAVLSESPRPGILAVVAAPPRAVGEAAPRWDFALLRKDRTVELRSEAGPLDAAPLATFPAQGAEGEANRFLVVDPQHGAWLALADDRSPSLTVLDPTPGPDGTPRVASRALPGPVRAIAAGLSGRVAVAVVGPGDAALELLLVDVRSPEAPPRAFPAGLGRPSASGRGLAFSPDGRTLAALLDGNRVAWWDLKDPARSPVLLPAAPGDDERHAALVFQPIDAGSQLVALGSRGGLTRWQGPGEIPDRVAPRTGRIRSLAAGRTRAPGGSRLAPYVLQITDDGHAGLWALADNEFRAVPGGAGFRAGALWNAPDPTRPGAEVTYLGLAPRGQAAIERRRADRPGEVVDRFTIPSDLASKFRAAGPEGPEPRTPQSFREVIVSADGRFLAASATEGAGTWAFVWDVSQPGTPRFVLSPRDFAEGLQATIERLDLSPLGDVLLTLDSNRGRAGNAATLWSLAEAPAPAAGPRSPSKLATLRTAERRGKATASVPSKITAARLLPEDPHYVALGTSLGRVSLFDSRRPADALAEGGGLALDVAVLDLAFAREGGRTWLAAGGDDAEVLFWRVEQGDRKALLPLPGNLRPGRGPVHLEAVASVVAAPGANPNEARFLTGGSDTTVRFWTVKEASATLDATAMATRSARGVSGGDDWVAFAPSGAMDGQGEGLQQLTLAIGGKVRPLGDWAEKAHRPGLLSGLLASAGQDPLDLSGRAPDVHVEHLGEKVGPAPRTRLRVSMLRSDLGRVAGVRLYHNGRPVDDGLLAGLKAAAASAPAGARVSVTASVNLRSGRNAFHALAYRQDWQAETLADARPRNDGLDGSSDPVLLQFDGPDRPGAVHVVAIGVGDYPVAGRALRYAAADARSVRDHFESLRPRPSAEGQPQAGTTAADEAALANAAAERSTFQMLLDRQVTPTRVQEAFDRVQAAVAEYPEDTVVVFLAGHADRIDQSRYALLLPGFPFPDGGQTSAATIPIERARPHLLAYYKIYGRLANLSALNRLVIVDACEAERIEDDPGVRAIRADLARTSARARTVNLMAARRGEAATESTALSHGLLTYALLRGLRAPGLAKLPPGLLDAHPDANLDRDEYITSDELRAYTTSVLPILSGRYVDLVQRGNAGGRALNAPVADQKASVSAPRPQGAGFPLVRLPGRAD